MLQDDFPVKKKRGRPKGSKGKKKKRGRPKGSKGKKKLKKANTNIQEYIYDEGEHMINNKYRVNSILSDFLAAKYAPIKNDVIVAKRELEVTIKLFLSMIESQKRLKAAIEKIEKEVSIHGSRVRNL